MDKTKNKKMPSGLKRTLLIGAIYGVIYGLYIGTTGYIYGQGDAYESSVDSQRHKEE